MQQMWSKGEASALVNLSRILCLNREKAGTPTSSSSSDESLSSMIILPSITSTATKAPGHYRCVLTILPATFQRAADQHPPRSPVKSNEYWQFYKAGINYIISIFLSYKHLEGSNSQNMSVIISEMKPPHNIVFETQYLHKAGDDGGVTTMADVGVIHVEFRRFNSQNLHDKFCSGSKVSR